jgi:PBP1b-binding outer membrane lipoprotein LpoB
MGRRTNLILSTDKNSTLTKLEQLRQKKAEGTLTQEENVLLRRRERASELSKKKTAEKKARLEKILKSPINGMLFSRLRKKS